MVRLLVLDMLRRVAYWQLALLALGFALVWAFFPTGGGASPVIAMSLAATYIIGPAAMLGWLGTPVVPYLPVSRRDVWRAAWIMGALAPLALMTTLKLPGTIGGGVAGWSSLTLSSFMDLLYAGAGCAFLAAANSLRGSKRAIAVVVLALPLVLGGVLWPFVVQQWLPANWAEVRPWHGAMFAIGAALTVWGALQSPASWWSQKGRIAVTSSGPMTLPAKSSGLSGLPRLLAHELAWSAGMAITLLVSFLLIALFANSMAGSFTTVEDFLAEQRLFVFDPASFRAVDQDVIFGQLGWYALFVAAVSARFPEALGHLRVLPLATARVHALLMGWPLVIWTAIWALLLIVHLGFSQPIETLRLPLWLALVALSQLAQGLRLRVSARWVPMVFLAIPFARMMDNVAGWILVSTWAIATAAAVALNVSALSRNETYKRTNPLAFRTQGLP